MWTTIQTAMVRPADGADGLVPSDKPLAVVHPVYGECRHTGNGWRVYLPHGDALRSGHPLLGRLRLFKSLDAAKAAAKRHHGAWLASASM